MKLIVVSSLVLILVFYVPMCDASRKVRCGSNLVNYWRSVCGSRRNNWQRQALENRYGGMRRLRLERKRNRGRYPRRHRRFLANPKFLWKLKKNEEMSDARMNMLLERILILSNELRSKQNVRSRRSYSTIVGECCRDESGCSRGQVLRYC